MIYYNLIADSTALQNAAAFDEEKIYRITLSSNYEDLISYALSSKLLTSIPFRHNDFWIPFLLSGPRKIDLKPTKKGSRTISDAFHGSSLISWFLCENFGSESNPFYICKSEIEAKTMASILLWNKFIIDTSGEDALEFSSQNLYCFGQRAKDIADLKTSDPESKDDLTDDTPQSPEFQRFMLTIEDDPSLFKFLLKSTSVEVDVSSRALLNPDFFRKTQESTSYCSSLQAPKRILLRLLFDQSLLLENCILDLFGKTSIVSQPLAIDFYWEKMRKSLLETHFCSNSLTCPACYRADSNFLQLIETLCNLKPYLLSESIRDCLLAAMIDEEWSPMKPNALNQSVIRPRLWSGLFFMARRASAAVSKRILEDAFSMFVQNFKNAISFSSISGWQHFLLPFIANDFSQETAVLGHNILTRTLYWTFIKSSRFVSVLIETLMIIETSLISGQPSHSLEKAYGLISALLQSLYGTKDIFAITSFSMTQQIYQNLVTFLDLIEVFLLRTENWGDVSRCQEIQSNFLMTESESGSGRKKHVRSVQVCSLSKLQSLDPQKAIEAYRNLSDVGIHYDPDEREFRFRWSLNILKKVFQLLDTLRLSKRYSDGSVKLSSEELKVFQAVYKRESFLNFLVLLQSRLISKQNAGTRLKLSTLNAVIKSALSKRTETHFKKILEEIETSSELLEGSWS